MSGWRQAIVIALALGVAAVSVVPIDLQRRIVDDAIRLGDASLLLLLGAIYAAALLASGSLKFMLRLCQGWLAESAILYCRGHLVDLQDDRQGDPNAENGAEVSIVRAEIEQVGGFVCNGLSDPVADAGMLCAILGYMFIVEPIVAACSIAFLAPQALLAPVMQRRVNALTERRIELLRDLTEAVAAESSAKGSRDASHNLFQNRMRIFLWKFIGKALNNLLNGLAPLGVLVVGGWMAINGQTELGVVVAFTAGLTKLADPLRALIVFYRTAAITAVKHRKIAEWMTMNIADRTPT